MTGEYRPAAALRALALAALGYLLILGIGAGVGVLLDDENFTGLGLIALTVVVLAPLGGLAGAAMGLRLYGDSLRPRLTWRWPVMATAFTIAAIGVLELPTGLTWLTLGLASSMVYRTGVGATPAIDRRRRQMTWARGLPKTQSATRRARWTASRPI